MQNFGAIPSGDLVDMLMKHTEYYLSLLKLNDKETQRAASKKKIDEIIAEIHSRKGKSMLPGDTADH